MPGLGMLGICHCAQRLTRGGHVGQLHPLHGSKVEKPSPSPVSPRGQVQEKSAYRNGVSLCAGGEETKGTPPSYFLPSQAFLPQGATVHSLGGMKAVTGHEGNGMDVEGQLPALSAQARPSLHLGCPPLDPAGFVYLSHETRFKFHLLSHRTRLTTEPRLFPHLLGPWTECPQTGPRCGESGGAGRVFADGVNGFDQKWKGRKENPLEFKDVETLQPGHVERS